MTETFRKTILILLAAFIATFSLWAVDPSIGNLKVSAYKRDTLEYPEVDFEVTMREYIGSNRIPADQEEIALDYEVLDKKGFSNLKLFTLRMEGNLANNAVKVDVLFKRMVDVDDPDKYIPISITHPNSTPSNNDKSRYTKPVLYEPDGNGGYYCYYYRYFCDVKTSRNGWINNPGGTLKVPLNWWIRRQLMKTSSSITRKRDFEPSDNDTVVTNLQLVQAEGNQQYMACPKDYRGRKMEFFLSVDYLLGISKRDWDEHKEEGHSYRLEVLIEIAPVS